jgi:four helix bundle protein
MESNLEVWKTAHQLTLAVYKVTQNFPKSEQLGLTSQVIRSVASVPTTIIEGQSRHFKKRIHSVLVHFKRIFGRNKLSFIFI